MNSQWHCHSSFHNLTYFIEQLWGWNEIQSKDASRTVISRMALRASYVKVFPWFCSHSWRAAVEATQNVMQCFAWHSLQLGYLSIQIYILFRSISSMLFWSYVDFIHNFPKHTLFICKFLNIPHSIWNCPKDLHFLINFSRKGWGCQLTPFASTTHPILEFAYGNQTPFGKFLLPLYLGLPSSSSWAFPMALLAWICCLC